MIHFTMYVLHNYACLYDKCLPLFTLKLRLLIQTYVSVALALSKFVLVASLQYHFLKGMDFPHEL